MAKISTQRTGADKSLALFISYLQRNQRIFLGWVKEVRTKKS
jgi:hypothetical protein